MSKAKRLTRRKRLCNTLRAHFDLPFWVDDSTILKATYGTKIRVYAELRVAWQDLVYSIKDCFTPKPKKPIQPRFPKWGDTQ